MNSDPARHAEVKRLFGGALERTGADRDRWLEEQCRGRADLRDEVRTLLAADAAPEPEPALPRRIGEFRILRRIGEGGMGTVYEAEQENPRRLVAIKVLGPFVVGDDAVRRFRYEAEILGQLDHPGIARVHAAGVEDGRPWFAMELIHGAPVTEYAASRGLGPRERLALLQRIARAVAHAHARGVVHRDLKPANILVDPDGNPKLVDFGIAKLVDGEARLTTLATRTGQLLGTVPYMAPEQVGSGAGTVDPRTDVYALGVLGYELLAGRRPLDLTGKSLAQALVAVREDEAPRLGTLRGGFRGDVETIIAKALAKEQGRRYGTAADFADDLGRHLRDEPILARPPTTTYQLRKFVLRHRALVASLVVVFLALVGATIVSGTYFFRAQADRDRFLAERNEARRQERRATSEAARADAERGKAVLKAATTREALDFMVDLFKVESPFRVRDAPLTTQDVLGRAVKRVSEDLADQPELQGELALQLAIIHEEVGDPAQAIALAELALAAARRAPDGDNDTLLKALSQSAGFLIEEQEFARAQPRVDELLSRARKGEGGTVVLAAALCLKAELCSRSGELDDSERICREILALQEETDAVPPRQLTKAKEFLADSLARKGRTDEALALLREALDLSEKTWGEDCVDCYEALKRIARVQAGASQFKEAVETGRALVARFLPQMDPDSINAISARLDLAQALGHCGEGEEGVAILKDCVERGRRVLGEDHPNFAAILQQYVEGCLLADHVDGLEAAAREMVERQRALQGPEAEWRLGYVLQSYGSVLVRVGRPEESLAPLREALEIVRRRPGIATAEGANRLIFTMRAFLAAHAYEEALPLARESLEVQKQVYGADSLNVTMATLHLGVILWRTGHADEAETTLGDARARLQVVGPQSGQMASALDGLDHLAEDRGDREAALAYARERLAIFEAGGEKARPYLADARARVEALTGE